MNNKKVKIVENVTWVAKLNNTIGALNRLTLMILVLVYGAVLFTVGMIASPKAQTTVIPEYDHIEYSEDVSLALAVFNNYPLTWTETSKNTIGVNAYIFRRTGMQAHNMEFKLRALLDDGFMYYFTQMNGYDAPITHTYTMQNVSKMPESFFMHLRYTDVNAQRQEYSFKEDLLTLSKKELVNYNDTNESEDIGIVLNFTENKEFNSETSQNEVISYRVDFGIDIANKDQQYHVDVQSWVVSENQEIYPFIGYYNYSNKSTNIRMSNRMLPARLNPEFMYVRVQYYTTSSTLTDQYTMEEILYKVAIS